MCKNGDAEVQVISEEKDMLSCLELNYKRTVTQMLILKVLEMKESSIPEVFQAIQDHSNGVLKTTARYEQIQKLQSDGFIEEAQKRKAPDNRLRQYFRITDKGKSLLQSQIKIYGDYASAIQNVLSPEEKADDGRGDLNTYAERRK